ncbi:MAG TPA: EAL domain-containing protein [Gammaproteobacteria bacterium]|nr:EAL domain-containing protein [Gammaproteobacteria bacterium]
MRLRFQILFSVLGITFLAQAVFGLLAYRELTESRGDQLTIFLQYLTREIAERLTLPGNPDKAERHLEELRKKFSTAQSVLLIQKDDRIVYIAGAEGLNRADILPGLKSAYSDSDKHGMIDLEGIQFYWAVSQLPNNEYELIMLEPAGDNEDRITSALRMRLVSSGFVILWMAVWVSLILSSKISRQLDEKNDQLEHLALHDNLTGLPNRRLLTDRLEQLLRQSQRSKEPFALLLIDLDRFKEINDTLGHPFGDEILKRVSSRLLKSIREEDSIARLGGDEFAVLLPQTDLQGSELCVNRIMHSMNAPFRINDVSTESKASIGIALYPEHGESADVLMQYADVAMYQAKKAQSGYAVYDNSQNTYSVRRLQLMNDLRDAVEKNEIHVHYQPMIDNATQQVTGVETLARWQHPVLGNITPDEFITMAEQTGQIRLLTMQVLEQALKDCSAWEKLGYHLGVSINLSTYCLQDLSLPEEINSIIQRYDVDVADVELEITEGALMHDLSRAGKILDQLGNMGLQLAIDDFGTGFSSLNYLKNLPVATLKIDKSFILDMCDSESDNAIVKTIIELGHNLGCRVVAEGIENQRTLDSLKLLNVDTMQGFFYSKPLPADRLFAWLIEHDKQVSVSEEISSA